MTDVRRQHDVLVAQGVDAGTLCQRVLQVVEALHDLAGGRPRGDPAAAVDRGDADVLEPGKADASGAGDRGQGVVEGGRRVHGPGCVSQGGRDVRSSGHAQSALFRTWPPRRAQAYRCCRLRVRTGSTRHGSGWADEFREARRS